ncbi:DUF2523 domain-containing protein [Salmonella enterica]|nr:DUF2523 domain-containing protein [Salmonella enterica]ECZ5385820.1 DUF2523 domain-containing protein [Salmonella enterica subsp. enterica serovar Montevideo]ECF6666793.1 DUF2523 domain-containing protein [Salmonella enterica]EFS0969297.1 DUF2523 domain-containing protein [Salmonella enterica]EGG9433593.1 DUF2523 domain-containing protein [Salmonella enterica]
MFAILIAAGNTVLAFLLRKVVIKFVLFGALYILCTEVPQLIAEHLPDISSIQTVLNTLPDGTWFFLDLFEFPHGVSAVVSALFVRFFIRRIPFFG